MATTTIVISFEGRKNRCKVINTLVMHEEPALALTHVSQKEISEYVVFQLRDNTNERLRNRLENIRRQRTCTVYRTPSSESGLLSRAKTYMAKVGIVRNPAMHDVAALANKTAEALNHIHD